MKQNSLLPEDREWLDPIVEEARQQGLSTGECSRYLWSHVQREAERGHENATRIAWVFGADGAHRFYMLEEKRDAGAVLLANGRIVSLPGKLPVAMRDDAGKKTGAFQLKLWTEMSWAEFAEKHLSYVRLRDGIDTTVATLQEISQLRDRYPQTATPGEACDLANIDPKDFKLPDDFTEAA